jgi:DNA-binding GntR family transcriptional regulator
VTRAVAMTGVISRSVLADQVRDHLLESIVDGHYPPDSRIVETQVARELGTSQAPVREALRALAAIGIVELAPFRGARVRRPSRAEILEAYAVRSALETLAARLATPILADSDLAELRADLRAMDRAADVDDGHGVAQADAAFHARIVDLAGNATLARVWRSLEPYSRTYLTLALPGADPRWSADLHVPILQALDARDGDAVADALERHFDEARANMATRWPPDSPRRGDPATDERTVADVVDLGSRRGR